MTHIIRGEWDPEDWYGMVTFDGEILDPRPSQKIFNHSPDGFSWGYAGSGPAQLALAILLKAGVPKKVAVDLHQRFKFEFIASQPNESPLYLEVDIDEWITNTHQTSRG